MVTSPLYDATRKVLNRSNVVSTLSCASLIEQKESGRILVKGMCAFRYDPYGIRVLESREYPTPVHPARKPTPTIADIVLAAAPKKFTYEKPQVAAPVVPVKVAAPETKPADTIVAKEKPVPTPSTSPAPQPEKPAAAAKATAEKVAEQKTSNDNGPLCRVLVEFKRGEDIYVSSIPMAVGDFVVVEGDRGNDMGKVIELLPVKGPSVARVVNIATQKDKDALHSLRKEEAAAIRLCQQRVKEHSLKMKIEDVEFQYDGGKVTIYYSSNCAVDFRQLQRQLFRDFRCRVWLRTVPASS